MRRFPTANLFLPFQNDCAFFFRFDRKLLGLLCRCVWETILEVCQAVLDRNDTVPGMIGGIQTFGELIHYHPHIHAIITDGVFTQDGTFIPLPDIAVEPFLTVWEKKVFVLLLKEKKISQSLVDDMRAWKHSGFSIDKSVYLFAGDTVAIEKLVQYIVRCPFSLARMINVSDDGKACRAVAFQRRRKVTQHIPEKGEHLIRYYG